MSEHQELRKCSSIHTQEILSIHVMLTANLVILRLSEKIKSRLACKQSVEVNITYKIMLNSYIIHS